MVETDLEPSEGLKFESNGDGTCTITGIGTCTEQNIVIPLESPEGDIVTLIGKYALYSLENVNSITLVNYTYEIDENAFQYDEFTAVNIIGGSPMISKSAFSSCEDLVSISFSDCNIQADEYAFYSCGKDANVIFTNCTGLPALFISCYNLLQVLLSLIFALMRVRNMREKDITRGKSKGKLTCGHCDHKYGGVWET